MHDIKIDITPNVQRIGSYSLTYLIAKLLVDAGYTNVNVSSLQEPLMFMGLTGEISEHTLNKDADILIETKNHEYNENNRPFSMNEFLDKLAKERGPTD